jgi:alanyl-tRNA synthetase
MDRQEAEGHFGTSIYDLCPAQEAGVLLHIVRIQDWEVCCCSKSHVESTGSIGAMRIDGAAFDEEGKELELRFHLPGDCVEKQYISGAKAIGSGP